MAIRSLLLDPRYRKWHNFDQLAVLEFDGVDRLEKEIWRSFAACHFNDECFRNFRYGKRSQRMCQSCPAEQNAELAGVLTPEISGGMRELSDTIRAYYQVLLGFSREKGIEHAENFRLRAYHTTIINSARMASSEIEGGQIKSSILKEGPMTLNELWTTILRHVEERGEI